VEWEGGEWSGVGEVGMGGREGEWVDRKERVDSV
jgi:hypothetical protein